MEEQATCGKGLAEHSLLPAKAGELIASLAENLELHMRALDLNDPKARMEHAAYLKLSKEFLAVATHLQATARQMAGYRDMPMGRHDAQAMSDPAIVEAFEGFVKIEGELLMQLRGWVERDKKMLAAMRGLASDGK
jgi:hypothetical protein